MTLQKDATIQELVSFLDLHQGDWEIRDHWESDLFAIGIGTKTSKGRLVYVSTFQKPKDIYDYECEIAGVNGRYESVKEGQNVSKSDLLTILVEHLRHDDDQI